MEYIRGTTEFHIDRPCVLSLGKFDGIHKGHELLLEHMKHRKRDGLAAVLFTFDIPPRPDRLNGIQKVLTTNAERECICRRHGVDYLVEFPFTPEIMRMEPEAFIEMLVRSMHIKCIVAGTDFRFGHERRGDHHLLRQYSGHYGYELVVVDKVQYEGSDISSSRIRQEVETGNMELVSKLLGYDYFVEGTVTHGRHLGTNALGIPTVNVIPAENKLLPPFGVYVCHVHCDGHVYDGIANVGCKPTIEGDNPAAVEAHIFDFAEDIYGRKLQISFLSAVRPERKFDSLSALKHQMEQDIVYGRQYHRIHGTSSVIG